MTPSTCGYCDREYDPLDPEQARRHTEPVDCEQRDCLRCIDKPECYMCLGSECFCSIH